MERQVRYKRLVRNPAYQSEASQVYGGIVVRDLAVAAALLSTLIIAVYVSVPDFPYAERPWQIQLWNESSGWWSEVTWVIAFGLFATLTVLFRSWLNSLRPSHDLALRVRTFTAITAVSWLVFVVEYLNYFKPAWSGFYNYFMLDRTGTLHGIFYITTAHIGVLAAIFGLALVSRAVSLLRWKMISAD